MQGNLLKHLVGLIYAQQQNILFDHCTFGEIDEGYIDVLEGFHLQELYLIEENDDRFCGIRANHFCVEYVYSEHFVDNKDQNPLPLLLITANHKGTRMMTLLKLADYTLN